MKKMQKLFGMLLVMLIAIGASVTTVSAAKVGDDLSVGGVGLGWILIGIVVIIVVILLAVQVSKKAAKPFVPILAILLIAGLILQCVDVAEEPGEITPSIIWSVSATADAGNVTIDDDARTITVLCHVNVTAETMLDDDDTAHTAPIINFTISPTQTTGLVDTSLGATTQAVVNNPDKEFTEDSTIYGLFADASGENKKDLAWVADGTTEYETHYCTVNFGSSETVLLTITFLDDGISQCEAGEAEAFSLAIGGITYTCSLIVTNVLT
jgi:hypothetical protein